MKWFHTGILVAWLIVGYGLVQRWPEARVVIPFMPVAAVLPLMWIRSFDAQLVTFAALVLTATALNGFGQLAVVYFIFLVALAGLHRTLSAPASLRILVVVMLISLFETVLGIRQAGYDTFLLAIFAMQSVIGFLVAYLLVDTKAIDFET